MPVVFRACRRFRRRRPAHARGERAASDWIINGQKIWTSGAHYSDYGILLTRTDPNVPKHKGLTMFFLDMKSPGVEIKPIKQANGQSEFNEVYFTDVRIPDAQRLGEVNDGWNVSLTTLMNERMSIGAGVVDRLSGTVRVLQQPDAGRRASRSTTAACARSLRTGR